MLTRALAVLLAVIVAATPSLATQSRPPYMELQAQHLKRFLKQNRERRLTIVGTWMPGQERDTAKQSISKLGQRVRWWPYDHDMGFINIKQTPRKCPFPGRILVICLVGERSAAAARELVKMGCRRRDTFSLNLGLQGQP